MRFTNRARCAIIQAILIFFCLVTEPALAGIIDYNFNANLQTGTLAGTTFSGSLSYDNSGMTGAGTEFFFLGTLDFTLLGVSFDRADIKQGGQAITQNGAFSYFTAAFFPPPPISSPVSDIAFGFGGPGVIGYIETGSNEFGLGEYTAQQTSVDEPSALGYFALGLAALVFFGHRQRVFAPNSPAPRPRPSDLLSLGTFTGKTLTLHRPCSQHYFTPANLRCTAVTFGVRRKIESDPLTLMLLHDGTKIVCAEYILFPYGTEVLCAGQ
jgi:hypothetical protein